MAQYSIAWQSEKKINVQERLLTSIADFSYNENYQTITKFRHYGGMWCSTGGTSRKVTIDIWIQLATTSGEVLKESSRSTITCHGSGPAEENLAWCEINSFTEPESKAVIEAWKNGTLKLVRCFEKTSGSTSDQPIFRTNSTTYYEKIEVTGEDKPPIHYGPTIKNFIVKRGSVNAETKQFAEDSQGESCMIQYCVDAMLDRPSDAVINFYMDEDKKPTTESCEKAWQSINMDYLSNYSLVITHDPNNPDNGYTFSSGKDYYWLMELKMGDETVTAESCFLRYSVPINISPTNNGVAIGKVSTATETEAKFECDFPAYFYKGLKQVFEVGEPTMCSGFETPGDYGHALQFYKIGNLVIVTGTIGRTTAGMNIICDIPEGFVPSKNAYFICSATSDNIARVDVNPSGTLKLTWYHKTNTTTNNEGTFTWLSIVGIYALT